MKTFIIVQSADKKSCDVVMIISIVRLCISYIFSEEAVITVSPLSWFLFEAVLLLPTQYFRSLICSAISTKRWCESSISSAISSRASDS